jgi:GlpG protein
MDYLLTLKVDGEVREAQNGWAIWVYSEDERERAARVFQEFMLDPDSAQYSKTGEAELLRRRQKQGEDQARKRMVDLGATWSRRIAMAEMPLTLLLMAVSIGVALVTQLGKNGWLLKYLLCTSDGLARGEFWRLVTPIFVHFSFLHILFNMMWLHQLGAMIEVARGRWTLCGLVLVVAAVPNVVQWYLAGPLFGGMSGVVYGLFGYVWMKTKFDPQPGLQLDPTTIVLMLVWFVFCLTGLAGPVANWVHGTGLVLGALFGILPVAFRR